MYKWLPWKMNENNIFGRVLSRLYFFLCPTGKANMHFVRKEFSKPNTT